MGIPTLISTCTADDDASCSFTSGITSAYDEYMFVITDCNPATNSQYFRFNGSTDGGSNYNLTKTTTYVNSIHAEDNSAVTVGYEAGLDLAQSTGYCLIMREQGNGADESGAGILQLFSPSNTTYVKHFYYRGNNLFENDYSMDLYVAGYFNTTSDIDAIDFKFDSGNINNAVIQMYGIS